MSTGPSAGLETSLVQDCRMVPADTVSAPEEQEGIQVLPSEAVIERYRCPQGLVDIVSSEPLSSRAGFFRFGPNSVFYGRSRAAMLSSRPGAALHDAADEVAV